MARIIFLVSLQNVVGVCVCFWLNEEDTCTSAVFYSTSSLSWMLLNSLFAVIDVSVVILVMQELGFDYLRDNLSGSRGQLVMRWYIHNH